MEQPQLLPKAVRIPEMYWAGSWQERGDIQTRWKGFKKGLFIGTTEDTMKLETARGPWPMRTKPTRASWSSQALGTSGNV